jgi:glycosyltransferase involved in cell wall biosynthesis
MNSTHVIHLVESGDRHDWLEKLIACLDRKGVSQTLITLEPDGNLYAYLLNEYPKLQIIKSHKKRLNPVTGTLEVLRARKGDSVNLIFALGHPAALIAAITSLFPRSKFIFSHMQQPNYFKLMKPRWRGVIHDFIYNLYVAQASLIHSLSGEVTEFLTKKNISSKKIFRVNIGVNFEEIREKLSTEDSSVIIPSGSPIILMVGRLAPEKNYMVAFETFAVFLRDYPQAQLLIAGVGPQEEELRVIAKELGISKNVLFLGYIGNVPRLMARADLLLHLATTESYGQIYIEAMLSKLPIVCSRTGVAIDFIESKIPNVYVANELSVESIVKKIELSLMKEIDSPTVNIDPFLVFKDHDEKVVHERIAGSFINFTSIPYDY